MIDVLTFFGRLSWLDRRPLLDVIEPYRRELFVRFSERDERGLLRYNLALWGRAKKNWKTTDVMLYALHAVMEDSPFGSQVYIVTNDEDQARDDLDLLKALIAANPVLDRFLRVRKNVIERRDGRAFIAVLAAGDVPGSHGKTFRVFVGDEIHGWRDWSLLEALQLDPHRTDAQILLTSYASIFHRPGVPLFDLMQKGRLGGDPRFLFSWYGGDFCTDPAFQDCDPETRANPSRGSWADAGYLEQQRRRLPAHKYRRLHLNLPGVPEGSAFQAEPVMDAVDRGVRSRPPVRGVSYAAFVDMSGGSSDDAVLAIGHRDADGRAVVDLVLDQGQRPPFDPNKAVSRFGRPLREYGVTRVTGDRYAGETFRSQFQTAGFAYDVADRSKSELYEALEPALNGSRVVLLDVAELEQQLLGLVWRGGRIDHPAGEHDDYSNSVAGLVAQLTGRHCGRCDDPECDGTMESMPLMMVGTAAYREWLRVHGFDGDGEPAVAIVDTDECTPAERASLWVHLEPFVHALETGAETAAEHAAARVEAHVAGIEMADAVAGRRVRALLDRILAAIEEAAGV